MINLILVEDQTILLESMALSLNEFEDMTVIQTYTCAADLIHSPFLEKAHVILMDVFTEAGANGIEVCKKIKGSHPHLEIVIMTGMPSLFTSNEARLAGAVSFIYKNIPLKDLAQIIRNAGNHQGQFQKQALPELHWLKTLTPREMKILRKNCEGKNRRIISEELFVSESTVKNDITSLLKKSGYKKLNQLVIYMLSNGYITSNPNAQ